jgi:acylphosphatase
MEAATRHARGVNDGTVRRRVVVRGRVQGVWFRASAAEEAERRGVGGFARNERDGSVLLELEGPPGAVDAVVGWCRSGPPRARVTEVVVEDVPPRDTRTFRTD